MQQRRYDERSEEFSWENKVKILIVDDSVMDRKLLTSVLKKNGVTQEILEAVNGEEGVKVLGEKFKEICLILLDWQMPVMDGLEFMKTVIKVPDVANIPIVMITASGSEENKVGEVLSKAGSKTFFIYRTTDE